MRAGWSIAHTENFVRARCRVPSSGSPADWHVCCGEQATRAYLHAEADVERALNAAGFSVVKREMTATSFYFSRLLEAVRR